MFHKSYSETLNTFFPGTKRTEKLLLFEKYLMSQDISAET